VSYTKPRYPTSMVDSGKGPQPITPAGQQMAVWANWYTYRVLIFASAHQWGRKRGLSINCSAVTFVFIGHINIREPLLYDSGKKQ
jgi:hypothetical protein